MQQANHIHLAIIGGSGYSDGLPLIDLHSCEPVVTPYGVVSDLMLGEYQQLRIAFLPRHGKGHRLAPHLINYRANIWALQQLGAEKILALSAVGGITEYMSPGTLAIPHQIIDYSYGREHTFFTGDESGVEHIDFTKPYSPIWRQQLVSCLSVTGGAIAVDGVYACTQGPRLETAAEIQKLMRDGADMVGMTGMPEAALARELQLEYVSLAIVVNWAAGISDDIVTMREIEQVLRNCKPRVATFLQETLKLLISLKND